LPRCKRAVERTALRPRQVDVDVAEHVSQRGIGQRGLALRRPRDQHPQPALARARDAPLEERRLADPGIAGQHDAPPSVSSAPIRSSSAVRPTIVMAPVQERGAMSGR
jgi:hypothetical protein